MNAPTDEVTALLACIRFELGTISDDAVMSALTTDLDWSVLLKIAIDHGVMPLLYQSLKPRFHQVPHPFMVQLQTYNRMNGLHNVSQTKELLRILAQFQKANIEVLPFKGSVLAVSAYGNLALRQFNDLDLLVRYQEFKQATAILTGQGYHRAGSRVTEFDSFHRLYQISLVNPTPEATLFNQQFQPSLLHSNPERCIDLHWGIPPRRVWRHECFEQLWQNLVEIDLMGHPTQTFNPELTLMIQCVNVGKEALQPSFKQICDVAQIIKSYPDLNWEKALELSGAFHCQQLFLSGLQTTHLLLSVTLPSGIREKLIENTASMKLIFDHNHNSLSARNTPGIWSEYREQLKTVDRPRDKIFITGFYVLMALLSLLRINDSDREFWPLPHPFEYLYFVIRPIRLLVQYPFGMLYRMAQSWIQTLNAMIRTMS
jgi:hypothetical protein